MKFLKHETRLACQIQRELLPVSSSLALASSLFHSCEVSLGILLLKQWINFVEITVEWLNRCEGNLNLNLKMKRKMKMHIDCSSILFTITSVTRWSTTALYRRDVTLDAFYSQTNDNYKNLHSFNACVCKIINFENCI